jgi:hypothetical protein
VFIAYSIDVRLHDQARRTVSTEAAETIASSLINLAD